MSDSDRRRRLTELNERIAHAKAAQDGGGPQQEEHYSQAQQGWRMVTELVAGLGIGFGIGYGLDVLLGTIPIFLVLFTLLGFAAGVKTMLRTATEFQANREAADAAAADERTEDGDRS